jgi:hypothetical protein
MSAQQLDYLPKVETPPPVRRALKARRVTGITTLLSLAFFMVNLPDGNPYQLESAMMFGLSFVLYIIAALWVWGARVEEHHRARRNRN